MQIKLPAQGFEGVLTRKPSVVQVTPKYHYDQLNFIILLDYLNDEVLYVQPFNKTNYTILFYKNEAFI